MKSILDFSFDDTHGSIYDIVQNFDLAWRELETREAPEVSADPDRDSIWLECNGELVDAASVKIVDIPKSDTDFEVVHFVCPRCNERHESPRLRRCRRSRNSIRDVVVSEPVSHVPLSTGRCSPCRMPSGRSRYDLARLY